MPAFPAFVPGEVFTLDEIARAAGVPTERAQALVDGGELSAIAPGLFTGPAAVAAGRRLRDDLLAAPVQHASWLEPVAVPSDATEGRRLSALLSTTLHLTVVGLLLWAASRPIERVEAAPVVAPARLVFVVSPGPGGGGGGGGMRARTPASALARRGVERTRTATPAATVDLVETTADMVVEPPKPTPAALAPEPPPKPVEPLPTRRIVAPVAESAPDTADRAGVVEKPAATASQGSGVGGGTGTGQGTGNGDGSGSGLGDGSGGGFGGGPYRPGSGVEPPRLLREVKADYTEEARRRGLTGEVVLEIVVRRDGSVGDVRVLRTLAGGLEGRAIAAVRQWRFSPATRRGEAVDVLVEVAVEFTLR